MGLRILAVDDETDATGVIAAILVSAGAEVKTAASVSQAMDLIKQWRPDVLISDIGMPDEDGYDLIRKYGHSLQRTKGIFQQSRSLHSPVLKIV